MIPIASNTSKHGDKVACSCGAHGTFDDMAHNTKEGEDAGYAVFSDAVWLSRDALYRERYGDYECHDCWLK